MARCVLDLGPEPLQVLFPDPMTELSHDHRGGREGSSLAQIRRRSSLRGRRRVALDLLKVAFSVGPKHEAPEHEELAGMEDPLDVDVAVDDVIHQTFRRQHSGTLNESTNVGVKTGGSRVGGPELCV